MNQLYSMPVICGHCKHQTVEGDTTQYNFCMKHKKPIDTWDTCEDFSAKQPAVITTVTQYPVEERND